MHICLNLVFSGQGLKRRMSFGVLIRIPNPRPRAEKPGPRKRRKSAINTRPLAQLALVIGSLLLIGFLSAHAGTASGTVFFLLTAFIAVVGFGLNPLMKWRALQYTNNAVSAAVSEHMNALVRKRAQLVMLDAYGSQQTGCWEKEVSHFLGAIVAPVLSNRQRDILRQRQQEFVESISARVASADIPSLHLLPRNATGLDFEAFCAAKLSRAGWIAQVTQGSRDQGVDVIATKNRVRVVLQCKLCSRPVGNKAVQEVAASRAHERADYAAVVSTSFYTLAAEQLAQTNGVLLLHFSQLDELEDLLA